MNQYPSTYQNPYADIIARAIDVFASGCPSLPDSNAAGMWIGEEDEQLVSEARKYGAAIWIHVPSAAGDAAACKTSRRTTETLEVLAVAAAMQGRPHAKAAADQLAWEIIEAANASGEWFAWQRARWSLSSRDTLVTTPTAVAVRLRFTAPCHLSEYAP